MISRQQIGLESTKTQGMYCKSTQAKVKAVRDMWNQDEDNLDTIIEDVSIFVYRYLPENFRIKSLIRKS